MNDTELKSLWNSYQEKTALSLDFGRKNAEDMARLKAENLLSSVKPLKILALAVGALWVLALTPVLFHLFLNAYEQVSWYFLFSAALQVALTAAAVVAYIYQLELIHRLDFSGPVLDIQRRLSRLQVSTLWATRLLVLQLPLWTTFYLSRPLLENAEPVWLIVQGIAALAALSAALWLFFNIKYENREKKWFKTLFGGKEWQPVLKAMEMLGELAVYEEDVVETQQRR